MKFRDPAIFDGEHHCTFIAFVAGGADEGIYQCNCGKRWETATTFFLRLSEVNEMSNNNNTNQRRSTK